MTKEKQKNPDETPPDEVDSGEVEVDPAELGRVLGAFSSFLRTESSSGKADVADELATMASAASYGLLGWKE